MQKNPLTNKKVSPLYKLLKWLLWLFYPKMKLVGEENIPNEPVIIVSNHAQMNGPIASELYLKGCRFTWCIADMMKTKDVPKYAFKDFWSQKPKYLHPFYKVLSYLIAPLASFLMTNAQTIPVYHDQRVMMTFKKTVTALTMGARVVVFPEYDQKFNNIIYDFQDKFIDIARLYRKRTGKDLAFVPMYITPKLKKLCFGKPIYFCSDNDPDSERARIKEYLMEEITKLAQDLPIHTVVPYRNIPKKLYPLNINPGEENKE